MTHAEEEEEKERDGLAPFVPVVRERSAAAVCLPPRVPAVTAVYYRLKKKKIQIEVSMGVRKD